jgi:hypothetical protein
MKIIDNAICVNNEDPKGIGRIRYRPYGSYMSEIEGSVKYEEWDEKDPFIALPFLPLHINVLPQKQQSVKILKYDTDKDTQNVEYVSGPFASPHNLQDQTFIQQNRDTTYGGVIVKNIKDIKSKDGKLIKSDSNGTTLKPTDIGIKGNYGSDIIFSENGVQIRGGYLRDRNNGDKQENLSFPIMSKKIGRFTMKKFGKSMGLKPEIENQTSIPFQQLKYIVEYDVNDINDPTILNLFFYRVKETYGNVFNTNVFDINTDITTNEIKTKVKLINTGNTETGSTITIVSDGTIEGAYINIRSILYKFYENKLDLSKYDYFNDTSLNVNVFPFYFRPTDNFRKTNSTLTTLTSNVTIRSKSGYGLIYSYIDIDPKPIDKKVTVNKLKELSNSSEQTFSLLSADKIFLTSTSPNGTDKIKTINFNELDKYELTQEDYVNKIDPNTYSLVRGEILLDIIKAFYGALDSHIHQINGKPIVGSDNKRKILDDLMQTLEEELLNKSIRIN